MKQLLKSGVVLAGLLASAAASASPLYTSFSAPVAGIFGGNSYTIFTRSQSESGVTWDEANAVAGELNGHLATITSEAENEFVFGLVKDYFNTAGNEQIGAWLGGVRDQQGEFNWVTGEDFSLYNNWLPGEPNDALSGENYLHYYALTSAGSTWNDYPANGYSQYANGNSFVTAFVVEHEGVSAVPVPAAAFLMAPALVGFMGLRRRAAKKA